MRLNAIPKKDWVKMSRTDKLFFGYMQITIYLLVVIAILDVLEDAGVLKITEFIRNL